MTALRFEASFIAGPRGRLFAVIRGPADVAASAVLVAPPFGDEMNKSRKMVSDLARALALRGVATVLVDPFGTGESAGEFCDADWNGWAEDLLAGARWAVGMGFSISGLLGIRTGVLLAAKVAATLPTPVAQTVFWQPVSVGQRFVTQFLRMRVAASLMEDRKESVSELRARIRGGEAVEVGGYEIGPQLLEQLDAAVLEDLVTPSLGTVSWFELERIEGEQLSAASQESIGTLRRRLPAVAAEKFAGEPFWTSTEIVRIPALVERTAVALGAAR